MTLLRPTLACASETAAVQLAHALIEPTWLRQQHADIRRAPEYAERMERFAQAWNAAEAVCVSHEV